MPPTENGMDHPELKAPPAGSEQETKLPFEIVISTTHRSPSFLAQTLASLFMAGSASTRVESVHLMVGSLEERYLDTYAHHGALRAHLMGKAEWSRIKGHTVHRRASYNYARCLALPVGASRGLLVCEDDIVFQDGFFDAALATIEELEEQRGPAPFILALYACYDLRNQPSPPGGERYARYEAHAFYGTQCVYFAAPLLPELADLVMREGFEMGTEPYDMVLKRYCLGNDLLFASRSSLVQHIGNTSTGLGNFHATPTFGCTPRAARTAAVPAT